MDKLRIGELYTKLKPRILELINTIGGGTGPFAPTPHGLNSPHHTGSLDDTQAPQFLKIDGTRDLIGNLNVANGITIDGVDISALSAAYDAHLITDAHTIYAHAEGSGTRRAYEAGRLNKSILAGNGLTGGGLLTTDQTLSVLLNASWSGLSVDSNGLRVNTAAAFVWTNDHVFQGLTKTRHLQPELTDTYDLGTSTLLWRKGWLSELDAILFAQNTVTLLGGWLLISKDEGAIDADVVPADTQINFGKTMTVGDFVLFRAAGKVEYMQVGSLVSGTTYNVTRNLDGSGADAWPAGTPYAVLGQSGQGRIELNAYDTPRLQVISQGASYNSQTELIRIGDLNGTFGITDNKYGIGIGQYGTNQNFLYYTPETGLVMRGRIYAEGGNISTFRETFDYNNIDEFIARVSTLVSGTFTNNAWLETTSDSVAGGKVLKVGDNSGDDMLWIHIGQPIPYNPKKLYRMFVRVRRTAGSGTINAGVAGVAADGVTLVNVIGNNDYSNQHYFCASAASPLSTWTEYIGYLSGTQTGGINGARPDPTNPLPLHQNARYFIPMILVNYSSQSGTYYIDEIRIDEITDTITADRIATSSLSVGTKLTIGQVADGKGRLELEANSDGTGTLKGIYRSGGIDTTQAYFGSDGKLYAGGGNVLIDVNGIKLKSQSTYLPSSSINFVAPQNTDTVYSRFWSGTDGTLNIESLPASSGIINIYNKVVSTYQIDSAISLRAERYSGVLLKDFASVRISAFGEGGGYYSNVYISTASPDFDKYLEAMFNSMKGFEIGFYLLADSPNRNVYFRVTNNGYIDVSQAISCRIRRTSHQSIPNNAWTNIVFDSTAEWDDYPSSVAPQYNGWDAIICRVAGTYIITAGGAFDVNENGIRRMAIMINGNTSAYPAIVDSRPYPSSTNQWNFMSLSTIVRLNVNDYVQLRVQQTSGGNLNFTYTPSHRLPFLAIARLA